MKQFALIVFSFALTCGLTTRGAEKLNVLFIVADDLRDTLGCYGNSTVKTPNIDRLAARGVQFDRAYVQYTVCNPSRSSFLTGLRPDQTQIVDNRTMLREKRPDVLTWPELLRRDGRHAAALGKIFHLGAARNAELSRRWADVPRSFDEAESFEATAAGKIIEGRNLTDGALAWCRWGMTAGTDDDQPDGQCAAAVVQLIQRLGERPWLIGAGFHCPHDPFVSPKKYFDLYPLSGVSLYRDPADMTPAPPLAVGFGDFGTAFRKFSDQERKEFQRAYYAGVSFMDAQVGRLLNALDEQRLWDKTVVIFVGDHGYHLGERQWWNKNTLFDRSCRAPMIMAAPGVKPGVARGIVEFVDLFPTIADLCGISQPEGLAGVSLVPLLTNPSTAGKKAAYSLVTRGQNRGDSVRTDRWRYTEWSDGNRELYDHETDPEENHNLAAAAEHQKAISELQQLLINRK
jgi:uncharacterized sulfatase